MMKKTAVLFVLINTLLFSGIFTGCSSNKPDSPALSDSSSPASAQNNNKLPDSEESAVSSWGTASSSDGVETAVIGAGEPAAPDSTFDAGADNSAAGADFSQVIADRDDLFFAIKEISTDVPSGYSWIVYIENRTDKNLLFSLEKVSVNGVMCDPFWTEAVMARKKGTCEITWMRDTLEERKISRVAQVDFTLNVYNDDDYEEAPLMHEQYTVYPLGENTSEEDGEQYARTVRQPVESDLVLIDNDDCTIIVTGLDPGNSWGYAMHLYLRNNTEEDLIFSTENTSVNGILCESLWAEIVTAGHSALSTILWDTAQLRVKGIAEVNEILLPIRVYPDNNITDPYVEETFEVRP